MARATRAVDHASGLDPTPAKRTRGRPKVAVALAPVKAVKSTRAAAGARAAADSLVRYPSQLVLMTTPETAAQLRAWAKHRRVSQADALRQVFEAGLAAMIKQWTKRERTEPSRALFASELEKARAMADDRIAKRRVVKSNDTSPR